jgi:hypothetical protein
MWEKKPWMRIPGFWGLPKSPRDLWRLETDSMYTSTQVPMADFADPSGSMLELPEKHR